MQYSGSVIGYDVDAWPDDPRIACLECAAGYDVSTYRVVLQGEANAYGDFCVMCRRALYND